MSGNIVENAALYAWRVGLWINACSRLFFVPRHTQFSTLEPATHAYSFWEGIPLEGRAAFGRLFRSSASLHSVVVVQRAIRYAEWLPLRLKLLMYSTSSTHHFSNTCNHPHLCTLRGGDPAAVMAELGFGPLLLITSFAVTMSGSGASFQVSSSPTHACLFSLSIRIVIGTGN